MEPLLFLLGVKAAHTLVRVSFATSQSPTGSASPKAEPKCLGLATHLPPAEDGGLVKPVPSPSKQDSHRGSLRKTKALQVRDLRLDSL